MKYTTLYERLVANTAEPESDQACWNWEGARDRWGYGRFNIRTGGKHVKLTAHIALHVLVEVGADADSALLLQAYQDAVASGLQRDHLCRNASCIHPDHGEWVTPSVNCQRRSAA